jgi:DNA-3-methyladenine glycosylase II
MGSYGRGMTTTILPTRSVVDWPVRGRFDLRQSVGFGFGSRVPETGSVMRLAFVLDGYAGHAGVAVTQPEADVVRFEVTGADPELASAQAARILSLDEDATHYDRMVDRDPLLRQAYAARPGLRPPLFHSAFEALTWSVLSARMPTARMRVVRDALARSHGLVLDIAGREIPAFPTPDQLLAVRDVPGVPDVKLRRLHTVAAAARDGELDTETLRNRDPEQVRRELQQLEGIGPFFSELVIVRALGHTDVLPSSEPRVVAAVASLLGRDHLSATDFVEVAEAWRPWRTWACVAIRAAAGSVRPARPPG